MPNVVVLGGGMVGATIAADLAKEPGVTVTVVDARAGALDRLAEQGVAVRQADLADPAAVTKTAAGADLVVGALPSAMGLATLGAVIEAGARYVDISFMAEDALALSARAAARGAVAVVDCGIAPGLSHMMVADTVARLAPCERLEILVGGLPAERRWPYEYKAAFAPIDAIEEYVRPARQVEHGEVVVCEALSGVERVDVPGVGTLEAFNTDGLRSLLTTMRGRVPHMREKTMRWPGHAELMRVLRATGYFSTEPIEVAGQQVVPREVTAALLFPLWRYAPGEADLTVLRVAVEGRRDGARVRVVHDLVDRHDAATDTRSMSRTTGFPAALVARLLLAGKLPLPPGVHPPEDVASIPGALDAVLAGLAARGVIVTTRTEAA